MSKQHLNLAEGEIIALREVALWRAREATTTLLQLDPGTGWPGVRAIVSRAVTSLTHSRAELIAAERRSLPWTAITYDLREGLVSHEARLLAEGATEQGDDESTQPVALAACRTLLERVQGALGCEVAR